MSSEPARDRTPPAGAAPSGPDPFPRALRAGSGRVVAAAPIAFVRTLHFDLLETFADETQDVLYRIGYDWGLRDLTAINEGVRTELGGASDVWQLDARFIFPRWWSPLAAQGWGAASFVFKPQARGFALIELENSLVAAALGAADDPVCHLYAGLFAGAVSFFDRTERHGVEIRCRASGSDTCTFVVGAGAEIDSVESWRQQGVTPEQIIQRLG